MVEMKLKNLIILIFIIILLILLIIYFRFVILNYNLTHLHTYLSFMKLNKRNINIEKNVVFIFSYDYKKIPEYGNYSIELLKKYCKYHSNYHMILKNHYPNNKISPYWLRVFDLIKLTKTYPEDSIFVYLDLDTCINPKYFHLKIEQLLDTIDLYENNKYSLYIGRDCNIFELLNTGVIFIRNNNKSREILNQWIKRYDSSVWKKNKNKWKCITKEKEQCNWAKDNYEQGELKNLYIKNTKYVDDIKILHSSICSNKFMQFDSFIYHFMGSKKNLTNFKYLYNQTK